MWAIFFNIETFPTISKYLDQIFIMIIWAYDLN